MATEKRQKFRQGDIVVNAYGIIGEVLLVPGMQEYDVRFPNDPHG